MLVVSPKLCSCPSRDNPRVTRLIHEGFLTTQVFRLKAEGYELSRKARIKPFRTFSVSTTFGSSRDESFNRRLKAKSLQPIYLTHDT